MCCKIRLHNPIRSILAFFVVVLSYVWSLLQLAGIPFQSSWELEDTDPYNVSGFKIEPELTLSMLAREEKHSEVHLAGQ
jgi:hypothetical protein